MNAPESFDLFVVPEGRKKVEYVQDLNSLHSGVFTLFLEDHTLGNSVKMMLLRNPKVRFAGYRMPHPLENKIEIKIQTNGEISPITALREALVNLDNDSKTAMMNFKEELEKFSSDRKY